MPSFCPRQIPFLWEASNQEGLVAFSRALDRGRKFDLPSIARHK
jgi:hypothetical protein